mgnify:CR=1 FL=1
MKHVTRTELACQHDWRFVLASFKIPRCHVNIGYYVELLLQASALFLCCRLIMESDFIGYTVLVTLKSPPNARVRGSVASVVGQRLTLKDGMDKE